MQDAEVSDLVFGSLEDRQCSRGRGRFKPEREKNYVPAGILLCNLQRVEWRINHPRIGSRSFCIEQAGLRAGHSHHVAEGSENDARFQRDRNRIVNSPKRNHAHRASGSVNHFDVRRQQIFDAVLEDRMGVPAADFHELQGARGHARDLIGELSGEVRLPVFVYEFHFAPFLLAAFYHRLVLKKRVNHVPHNVIERDVSFLYAMDAGSRNG